MIARRILLASAALAPLASAAQERVARIGLLRATPPQARDFASLRAGLEELGYVVGRNLVILARHADGDVRRLPALASELAALAPAVVVVDGEPSALAMREAAPAMPVVFTLVGDPVVLGLAESLSRPGGNLTGLTNITREITGKRLSLLKETIPTMKRVAILGQPRPGAPMLIAETLAAAAQLGLDGLLFEARAAEEIAAAFARIAAAAPDGLITLNSPLFYGARREVVAHATALGKPQIYPEREFVEAGGLMAYGADFEVLWRRAAFFVDRILKGARPGELPVEQPVRLLLSINLGAARRLGIEFPQAIQLLADEVID